MSAPATRAQVRWSDLFGALFIAAFLLPNIVALVIPYEEFPYTSAPMFAHYVGDDTPRYRFRLIVEPGVSGKEREIHATELGLAGLDFSRHFFVAVYGSIEHLSPFSRYVGDTREAFEERLSRFLRDVVTVLERTQPESPQQASRIRLEVSRLDNENQDVEIHVVGYYDVASGLFTHTWGR